MVISFKGKKQTRPQTCRFAPRQKPCDIDFVPSILTACVKKAAILKRMNACKLLNWENRSKWRVETMQWRGFFAGCTFWNCGAVLITSASFGSLETVMLLWFAITSQDISWLLPIIIEQSAFSDRSLQQPFIDLSTRSYFKCSKQQYRNPWVLYYTWHHKLPAATLFQ